MLNGDSDMVYYSGGVTYVYFKENQGESLLMREFLIH